MHDAFTAFLVKDPADPGSQLSAYVKGLQVVDLWAGDGMGGDSLTGTLSAIKGATHLVVALLVQDGVVDLDRRVAEYWPEFAAEGKGELTLRELLAHRSGAIGVDGGFTLDEVADDRVIAARLAPHRPYWTPGTAHGYHGLVIGALTGEVVRRVTGRSIQEHFEERVRAPYGLDLYMGLPESLEDRWVPVLPMAITPEQQAEMYAAILGEVDDRPPLLKRETIAEFAKVHSSGIDLVTRTDVHTFALGFEVQGIRYPFLGPDAFGHSGAAGAQAFADPRSGVTYGYVRRRFQYPPEGGAARWSRLPAGQTAPMATIDGL